MNKFFNNLKFSYQYIKTKKILLAKFLITYILFCILSILVPIFSALIIINLTSNLLYQLLLISLTLLGIKLLSQILLYFNIKYSWQIYNYSMEQLQSQFSKMLLKLDNETLNKNGSGTFVDRLLWDTQSIGNVFNALNYDLFEIISNIGVFVTVFVLNIYLFLFFVTSSIILFLLNKKQSNLFYKRKKYYKKYNDEVTSFTSELVRGAKDIKMLNAEEPFFNKFHNQITHCLKLDYEMNMESSLLRFFIRNLENILQFCFIFLLVYFISNGSLEISIALIIYNYTPYINNINTSIKSLLDEIDKFNLSSNRIREVLENDGFNIESFGTINKNIIKGDFEFRNVSFSYKDNLVLNNLNFKINANETVAFVGKSGAGKSTIFNLLCKMYEVDSGEIFIDDINIKELTKDSIRGNITVINQTPYIFNLSIKDNLKIVKADISDEEIIEACKSAYLHDFITSLEQGYDTIVGEGGVNLSGGQKQRLAIARALVQKTEIILFDEATSALDNDTQNKITMAINKMRNNYTILIVAHRLSTIINCDKIFYLENGSITNSGTHKELLNSSTSYKELFEAEVNI